jgi:hypothetical protein
MVSKVKAEQKIKQQKDKEWAEAVKQRDKHCVICKSKERINAHHLFPKQIEKLRWDLDNGITLCPKHHRFSFQLSAHQNPLAFFLWLWDNRREQYNKLIIKWQ